jgi:hypothetical protein
MESVVVSIMNYSFLLFSCLKLIYVFHQCTLETTLFSQMATLVTLRLSIPVVYHLGTKAWPSRYCPEARKAKRKYEANESAGPTVGLLEG